MKSKKIIPVLLLASGISLASCATSSASTHHSKSFEAGVNWVRKDFPNTNESSCFTSILNQGASCKPIKSGGNPDEICASNGAILAINTGNYNGQQWVNGCVSVPFRHWPKWLRKYFHV